MKKNLLSLIILFLLVINIVLTAIMVFSLVTTNQRANALMADVASVLKLELPPGGASAAASGDGGYVVPDVPIANVVTYDVNAGEQIMIPLMPAPEDTTTKYIILTASLSLDSKNKGFKDNKIALTDSGNADLSKGDVLIQDIINRTFSKYTSDQVRQSDIVDQIKAEIIQGLQGMYSSDFIYNVQFREVKYS
jgi:flagellar FliL protein